MFFLSETPLDPVLLRPQLVQPNAGAFAVFEGWVRSEHRGRGVLRLEYEAFAEMALTEGRAIVDQVQQRFPGCRVLCVHRTGLLEVGEIAVWIGATAPHRSAAFAACRSVIEELKRRLPIWKKEHFSDGAAEWVDCTLEHNPTLVQKDYHSRQTRTREIGDAGQARLTAAKVLVVGVGGLGTVAADALATAGVGHLDLLDPGLVELSNLPRQTLFSSEDVGTAKAAVAEMRLRARNPFSKINGHNCSLTEENALSWVAGRTVVLDCSDGFATRFLLHDVCRELSVPLVQAAAIGWDGVINTFGVGSGACLHCLWPGHAPGDLADAGDCAGGAVFGPAVNAIGLMQATETIKLIVGLPVLSATQTLLVSWLDYSVLPVARTARLDCPVCHGGRAKGNVSRDPDSIPLQRSITDLARSSDCWQILSLDSNPIPAALVAIPSQCVAGLGWTELRTLASTRPTIVTCARGIRSVDVVKQLRSEGVPQVYALTMESTEPARTEM